MRTSDGFLTYCTNIHAGEAWEDHFAALKQRVPSIKERLSKDQPFGLGLRLSNEASRELLNKDTLESLKNWLSREGCYIFTMNGFPYGGFHRTRVKDQVHAPDWTTPDRVSYTMRLFDILAELLPDDMEGGISTSPLSYKLWYKKEQQQGVFSAATQNILAVLMHLIQIRNKTGKHLHLDIEPEPDGLLGNGPEFIEWYEKQLLPMGRTYLHRELGYSAEQSAQAIEEHLQLCYDVCHFAVGYEDHNEVIRTLREKRIRIGKIQISAALKAEVPRESRENERVMQAFKKFDESTYLHQVVARQTDGSFKHYADLSDALRDSRNGMATEWRSHFHVPLFVDSYGLLQSTQDDIRKVLAIHQKQPFTRHLEVETYTWEVLPDDLKLPLAESIIRELEWVMNYLNLK